MIELSLEETDVVGLLESVGLLDVADDICGVAEDTLLVVAL